MKLFKKFTVSSLIALLLSSVAFSSASAASTDNIEAPQTNDVTPVQVEEVPDKEALLENGVEPKKVDALIEKMENGEELEADKYLEEEGNKEEIMLATEENPYFRKDFADGSFIENTIEDITNENQFSTLAIDQIGGTQTNRTLKITTVKVWGKMEFKVKIYFPQGGYGKITQAYGWYYHGLVAGENYKGIYRASETASQDAVAIYKLVINTVNTGVTYLAKTEFRIRDGRYWTVYSN
ncbi:hypothetical protein [Rossellomorea marisflavi]|uniref:hypothetical protein n=1 Tax=Rossellomorea marisflavi TaxID=189381 RepID=UPI00345AE83A